VRFDGNGDFIFLSELLKRGCRSDCCRKRYVAARFVGNAVGYVFASFIATYGCTPATGALFYLIVGGNFYLFKRVWFASCEYRFFCRVLALILLFFR